MKTFLAYLLGMDYYLMLLRPEGGVNVIFSVFTYVTELLKTNK